MRSRYTSRQSKTFTAKRRARGIARTVSVAGIICIIILILWALSSWSAFTVTSVQVSGIEQEEVQSIHDKVMEVISGSYLGMFACDNSLIYPRAGIRQAIQDAYPEAESVEVRRTDRHTLTISIKEKKPAALVCATLPDFDGNDLTLDDSGACYFTDAAGTLFKKAPSFSGAVYNRYYLPDLTASAVIASSTHLIGVQATSTAEFVTIQQIYSAVQHNDITVDAMLMKGGGEYELYIRNPDMSSSTAIVYFNTISPVAEQISNFISFWDHTLSDARAKKERLEFDYIDVRYSPNVYHRFAR